MCFLIQSKGTSQEWEIHPSYQHWQMCSTALYHSICIQKRCSPSPWGWEIFVPDGTPWAGQRCSPRAVFSLLLLSAASRNQLVAKPAESVASSAPETRGNSVWILQPESGYRCAPFCCAARLPASPNLPVLQANRAAAGVSLLCPGDFRDLCMEHVILVSTASSPQLSVSNPHSSLLEGCLAKCWAVPGGADFREKFEHGVFLGVSTQLYKASGKQYQTVDLKEFVSFENKCIHTIHISSNNFYLDTYVTTRKIIHVMQ